MSYDFEEMVGTAYPEEIAESICFTIMEFASRSSFEDEKDGGAKRLILDFAKVPQFEKWDQETVGCVLEKLPDSYLSEIAGRPVHKMVAMNMAVAL